MHANNSESTLYLPIKQKYFDEIIAGTKDKEFREIKDTTFTKYLATTNGYLDFDDELISENDELNGDICIYNNGKYPYYPIEYKYLSLAVGYAKERDTAIVEITSISFEVLKNQKTGENVIFDIDKNGKAYFTPEGHLAFWNIVYCLGKIIEIHRKNENGK